MATKGITYRLDAADLEHTLGALRLQLQKVQLSTYQRRSFLLLRATVYSFAGLFLLLWLSYDTPLEDWLNDWLDTFLGWSDGFKALASSGGCFLAALAALLVVVNLPMIRIILRQIRLAREIDRLQLKETLPPARIPQAEGLGFWLKVFSGVLLLAVLGGLYFAAVGDMGLWRMLGVTIVFGGGAFLGLTRRMIPLPVLRKVFWILISLVVLAVISFAAPSSFKLEYWDALATFYGVLLLAVLPALVFVADRVLARVGEQLQLVEELERLGESLRRRKSGADETGSGYFDLSAGEALRLAKAESSVIQRSRVAAIASSRSTRATSFSIRKSPMAKARLGGLEPGLRFRVESEIQELALEPQPPEAAPSEREEQWLLEVSETPIEIVYRIDEGAREVEIVTVRPPADGDRVGDSP